MSKPPFQRFAKCFGETCPKLRDFGRVLQQRAAGTHRPCCPCTGRWGSGPQGISAIPHLLPTPDANSTRSPVRVDGNAEGHQPRGQHLIISPPFLERSSGAQAKSFYRGEKQPPRGTGQGCVRTAASSRCRGARWQAAQARASQTLLAFVSVQSEFSYVPRETQPRRAPSAYNPGCGQRRADQSTADVSFLLESVLSLA